MTSKAEDAKTILKVTRPIIIAIGIAAVLPFLHFSDVSTWLIVSAYALLGIVSSLLFGYEMRRAVIRRTEAEEAENRRQLQDDIDNIGSC